MLEKDKADVIVGFDWTDTDQGIQVELHNYHKTFYLGLSTTKGQSTLLPSSLLNKFGYL